jgi:hypothetical protein
MIGAAYPGSLARDKRRSLFVRRAVNRAARLVSRTVMSKPRG